ncbi:hypothetical protein CPB83DRAFT_755201, partial [Crepidotus variabilis]
YQHPNGDHYYFNPGLRLLTTDDIHDPIVLGYIVDARDDIVQQLVTANLPADYELVITDTSEIAATIRIYSRSAGQAYLWTEENGRYMIKVQHFWTFVAEFPSHHLDLPPNAEREFAHALETAKTAIASGGVFPFTSSEIDQIVARFETLKALRSEGQNTTPPLAWLIGMVMPLGAVNRRVNDHNLEAMMNGLHT